MGQLEELSLCCFPHQGSSEMEQSCAQGDRESQTNCAKYVITCGSNTSINGRLIFGPRRSKNRSYSTSFRLSIS